MRDIADQMSMETVDTYKVSIHMAGDIGTAYRVIREYCYLVGACFTVTPTKFIYTGGEEDGFIIGLVNYPRFPKHHVEIDEAAKIIAARLLVACNQRTCLLVGTMETVWLSSNPPGGKPP